MWNKVVNKIDQNISPTKEHVLQRGRGHDKKRQENSDYVRK